MRWSEKGWENGVALADSVRTSFYTGEENPRSDIIGELTEQDLGTGPEVVFVVGPARKVPGARRLVTELCRAAKAQGGSTVWIN